MIHMLDSFISCKIYDNRIELATHLPESRHIPKEGKCPSNVQALLWTHQPVICLVEYATTHQADTTYGYKCPRHPCQCRQPQQQGPVTVQWIFGDRDVVFADLMACVYFYRWDLMDSFPRIAVLCWDAIAGVWHCIKYFNDEANFWFTSELHESHMLKKCTWWYGGGNILVSKEMTI